MSYLSFLSKEFKLYLDTLKQDFKNRQNKDFFNPFGTQVHCGRQGSGKTISAVHVLKPLSSQTCLCLVTGPSAQPNGCAIMPKTRQYRPPSLLLISRLRLLFRVGSIQLKTMSILLHPMNFILLLQT